LSKRCFVIGPMSGKDAKVLQWLANDVVRPLLPADFEVTTPEVCTPDNIMNHVIRSCDRAQLVIANVTGNNPNVFYEVAVLDALGRARILVKIDSAQDDHPDNMPFDLKAYRHIEMSSSKKDRAETARKMGEAIAQALEIRERGDLFENPLTDYFGVPLSSFSSVYALARGYLVNLIAPTVEGIDHGDIKDSACRADTCNQRILQVIIPDRIEHATRSGVERAAVRSGRAREVTVIARSRDITLYEWTKQEPGSHRWMDIPTTMHALHETVLGRLGHGVNLDPQSPEFREVEQDEIGQFERYFRRVMQREQTDTGALACQMVEIVPWSKSSLA
jgi:hypothetical protein